MMVYKVCFDLACRLLRWCIRFACWLLNAKSFLYIFIKYDFETHFVDNFFK